MSKAILILDKMPTSCFTCPINSHHGETHYADYEEIPCEPYCDILEDWIWTDADRRAPDCPLRDLPDHITEKQITPDEYQRGYINGLKHGYNEALDDIGGRDESDSYTE